MELSYRPAHWGEDLDRLTAFLSRPEIDRAFVKPLSERDNSIEARVYQKKEKGNWILAEYEDEETDKTYLADCLALIPSQEKELEISTFAVSPEYNGQGIGSGLLEMAIYFAKYQFQSEL